MKKNLSTIFFFMLGFILFLFFFPLVEGFEDCIVDTLANMKIEISSLREDVDKLKEPQNSAQPDVANSELANNTADTYDDLNNGLSEASTI